MVTSEKDAPAEMSGVEERAFNLAARAMQRRFGASGTEEDIEAALSEFFAPILAEKERDNRQLRLEVAEERETSRISIYGWRDKANEMEARALAAEAALAEAEERCAKWADKVAAAIRAQE